ncbi:MAG: hypothetical protein NC916_00660, partial [Candidatus Omnitrophica bacterium]|nr:hypothetical protein [Candidatus Omnitrophota bacterium]
EGVRAEDYLFDIYTIDRKTGEFSYGNKDVKIEGTKIYVPMGGLVVAPANKYELITDKVATCTTVALTGTAKDGQQIIGLTHIPQILPLTKKDLSVKGFSKLVLAKIANMAKEQKLTDVKFIIHYDPNSATLEGLSRTLEDSGIAYKISRRLGFSNFIAENLGMTEVWVRDKYVVIRSKPYAPLKETKIKTLAWADIKLVNSPLVRLNDLGGTVVVASSTPIEEISLASVIASIATIEAASPVRLFSIYLPQVGAFVFKGSGKKYNPARADYLGNVSRLSTSQSASPLEKEKLPKQPMPLPSEPVSIPEVPTTSSTAGSGTAASPGILNYMQHIFGLFGKNIDIPKPAETITAFVATEYLAARGIVGGNVGARNPGVELLAGIAQFLAKPLDISAQKIQNIVSAINVGDLPTLINALTSDMAVGLASLAIGIAGTIAGRSLVVSKVAASYAQGVNAKGRGAIGGTEAGSSSIKGISGSRSPAGESSSSTIYPARIPTVERSALSAPKTVAPINAVSSPHSIITSSPINNERIANKIWQEIKTILIHTGYTQEEIKELDKLYILLLKSHKKDNLFVGYHLFNHSVEVGHIAFMVAARQKFSRQLTLEMLIAGLIHDYQPRPVYQAPKVDETIRVMYEDKDINSILENLNVNFERITHLIRGTNYSLREEDKIAIDNYLKNIKTTVVRRDTKKAIELLALIDKSATYIYPQLSIKDVERRIRGLAKEIKVDEGLLLKGTHKFLKDYVEDDIQNVLRVLPVPFKQQWNKIRQYFVQLGDISSNNGIVSSSPIRKVNFKKAYSSYCKINKITDLYVLMEFVLQKRKIKEIKVKEAGDSKDLLAKINPYAVLSLVKHKTADIKIIEQGDKIKGVYGWRKQAIATTRDWVIFEQIKHAAKDILEEQIVKLEKAYKKSIDTSDILRTKAMHYMYSLVDFVSKQYGLKEEKTRELTEFLTGVITSRNQGLKDKTQANSPLVNKIKLSQGVIRYIEGKVKTIVDDALLHLDTTTKTITLNGTDGQLREILIDDYITANYLFRFYNHREPTIKEEVEIIKKTLLEKTNTLKGGRWSYPTIKRLDRIENDVKVFIDNILQSVTTSSPIKDKQAEQLMSAGMRARVEKLPVFFEKPHQPIKNVKERYKKAIKAIDKAIETKEERLDKITELEAITPPVKVATLFNAMQTSKGENKLGNSPIILSVAMVIPFALLPFAGKIEVTHSSIIKTANLHVIRGDAIRPAAAIAQSPVAKVDIEARELGNIGVIAVQGEATFSSGIAGVNFGKKSSSSKLSVKIPTRGKILGGIVKNEFKYVRDWCNYIRAASSSPVDKPAFHLPANHREAAIMATVAAAQKLGVKLEELKDKLNISGFKGEALSQQLDKIENKRKEIWKVYKRFAKRSLKLRKIGDEKIDSERNDIIQIITPLLGWIQPMEKQELGARIKELRESYNNNIAKIDAIKDALSQIQKRLVNVSSSPMVSRRGFLSGTLAGILYLLIGQNASAKLTAQEEKTERMLREKKIQEYLNNDKETFKRLNDIARTYVETIKGSPLFDANSREVALIVIALTSLFYTETGLNSDEAVNSLYLRPLEELIESLKNTKSLKLQERKLLFEKIDKISKVLGNGTIRKEKEVVRLRKRLAALRRKIESKDMAFVNRNWKGIRKDIKAVKPHLNKIIAVGPLQLTYVGVEELNRRLNIYFMKQHRGLELGTLPVGKSQPGRNAEVEYKLFSALFKDEFDKWMRIPSEKLNVDNPYEFVSWKKVREDKNYNLLVGSARYLLDLEWFLWHRLQTEKDSRGVKIRKFVTRNNRLEFTLRPSEKQNRKLGFKDYLVASCYSYNSYIVNVIDALLKVTNNPQDSWMERFEKQTFSHYRRFSEALDILTSKDNFALVAENIKQ